MAKKVIIKTDAEIEQEQVAAEQSGDAQEPTTMNADKTFNYSLPGDAKGRIRTTRRIDWDAILD